jgi:hypothetical protein
LSRWLIVLWCCPWQEGFCLLQPQLFWFNHSQTETVALQQMISVGSTPARLRQRLLVLWCCPSAKYFRLFDSSLIEMVIVGVVVLPFSKVFPFVRPKPDWDGDCWCCDVALQQSVSVGLSKARLILWLLVLWCCSSAKDFVWFSSSLIESVIDCIVMLPLARGFLFASTAAILVQPHPDWDSDTCLSAKNFCWFNPSQTETDSCPSANDFCWFNSSQTETALVGVVPISKGFMLVQSQPDWDRQLPLAKDFCWLNSSMPEMAIVGVVMLPFSKVFMFVQF